MLIFRATTSFLFAVLVITPLWLGSGTVRGDEALNDQESFAGVGYFEIPVSNLDRAIAFYEAVFQISLVSTVVDGHDMALFPVTNNGGASGALAKGEVYLPAKAGPILYFTVSDIEEVLDRVRNLDHEILLPVQEVPGQGRVAEFEDSEGNRIALFQPIETN